MDDDYNETLIPTMSLRWVEVKDSEVFDRRHRERAYACQPGEWEVRCYFKLQQLFRGPNGDVWRDVEVARP